MNESKTSNIPLLNQFHPVIILVIFFSIFMAGVLVLTPTITKMNLRTYIASLSTKTITVTQLQQIRSQKAQSIIVLTCALQKNTLKNTSLEVY